MTRLFRLAVVTAIASYALIVLGGITRVSGSGLGCEDDWPLCQGRPYPPLNTLAIIEYMHRTVAATITFLVIGTLIGAFMVKETSLRSRKLAVASLGLVIFQAMLGALTVWGELPPSIVTAHLGTAMIYFAVTILTAYSIAIDRGAPVVIVGAGRDHGLDEDRTFTFFARIGAAVIFGLILTGGLTSTTGAALACWEWPTCGNGQIVPNATSRYTWFNLSHRTVALVATATVAFILVQALRRPISKAARKLAIAAAAIICVQIMIGAMYVFTDGDAWLSGTHLATAAALWATMLALALVAHRPGETDPAPVGARVPPFRSPSNAAEAVVRMSAAPPTHAQMQFQGTGTAGAALASTRPNLALTPPDLRRAREVVADYVALMKPGILSLLLATMFGAMFVAAAAVPSFSLLLAALIGGTLAAGGANVLNCYLDRDIDARMPRTRSRGTATGRILPRAALIFGITLSVISVLVFGLFVNWLAAGLSLVGNLYYVFVYTKWLKRTTPQNIVIGGAAGAMPPLVGWAAVTGSLSVAAVLLFAVIYYWTPPHFWALALLKQGEYGRAEVPMLPVVAGEDETRRQVVLYSILLAAVSLMLIPFGFGEIYFASAVVLNGLFVLMALRLQQTPSKRLARQLFMYSLWYLLFMFVAMVADRLVLG
ncbi:MAG: heme o synthase [Thermomicrobiales bacterium]